MNPSVLTSRSATRTIAWALLASVAQALIFWFVTSGPRAPLCTNCTEGHLVNATDVYYYFKDTSPDRSRETTLVEYPPLAKAVLLIPRLLAAEANTYARVFEREMLLCGALTALIIAWWSSATAEASAVPRRLAWYTAYVAALSPIIYTRFDLVPTLLAFAAATAWSTGRSTLGAVGAALGAFTKLFPVCVAAVGLVRELMGRERTRMRGTVVFAVSVPVLTALSWTFGGHALFTSYLDRKLQLESAFAGILMVVGRVAGLPMAVEASHGAVELGMRGTRLLATLTLPVQGALLSVTLYAFWRSRGAEFLRYSAAAIVALIVPAKVLSPQFLIWLIPFVSVLEGTVGPRARWLFLASCVATTVIFPFRYADLSHFHWWAIGLLNLRNALLIILLGLLVRDARVRTAAGPHHRPD